MIKNLTLIAIGLLLTACASTKINVQNKAELTSKQGWQKEGYGNIVYTYTNDGDKPVKMTLWQGDWIVDGKVIQSWHWDETQFEIAPGETISKTLTAWMPPNVADLADAKKVAPVTKGFSTIVCDGETNLIPFEVEIPVAKITDPMREVSGKFTALKLREKNFENFENCDKALAFLDETYLQMQELTGYRPYDNAVIVLEESPAHHAWAYAGNPINLNEKYVPVAVKEMNQGVVCSGWVHEMGHDFDDVIGEWYICDGPDAEFQANIKLVYVYENILTNGSFYYSNSWLLKDDKYPKMTGQEWMAKEDKGFYNYLYEIITKHGWKPVKGWYRAYQKLAAAGLKPPTTPAEKQQLTCAIFSQLCQEDLTQTFKKHKFEVSQETVKIAAQKYRLKELI